MNFASNNQTITLSQQQGTANIMGNNNTIFLTQCQFMINVIGNGNTLHLYNCKIQSKVGGNGNTFQLTTTRLKIGIKGNGNQIIFSNQNLDDQANCQIMIMYNQGSYNTFPPSAMKKDSSHQNNRSFPNNHVMSNNPQQCELFNNQFNNANMFNHIPPYPPPPPPPPQITNPFRTLSESMEENYFNYPDYDSYRPKVNNSRNNNNNNNYFNNYNNNNNNNNNIKPSSTNRRILPPNNRLKANRYLPKTIQPITFRGGFGVNSNKYNHIRSNPRIDEEEHEIIPNFTNQTINNRGTQSLHQNHHQHQPRYAYNQQSDVRALTDGQIDKLNNSKFTGKTMNCSICLQDICQGNDVIFLFCFHSYHSKCVKNWLKKSGICPLCQLDLTSYLE